MESIDKLSLELLTNRRKYNKYLDKIDPQKNEENIEFNKKIVKYKYSIINLIKEFLSDTSQTYNSEIDELLPLTIKKCIRYFEMKEMEEKREKLGTWTMDGPDEEDEIDEYEDEKEEEEEESLFSDCHIENNESNQIMKSYWGKSYIKKL